jgi:bacterioferritin (cytochrome b1)
MTREEAIEMLKSKMDGNTDISYEWAETVRMAIKALEQEPCEDCVSRKALIERINHAEENFKADNMESIGSDDGDPFVDGVLSGVFNIREMVIQAPSVTLQEPFKPIVEIDLYSVIKRKYIEREVLDKIRAEIEEHVKINQNLNTDRAKALCWCLDVIDKYKAESENKE